MAKPVEKRSSFTAATVANGVALALLTVALLLSAYNLSLTVANAGELAGLTKSWDSLLGNYGTRVVTPAATATTSAASPTLLWSIVHFRDGEEQSLPRDLVAPLLAQYENAENPVSVLLIERKNAKSRDVNVRIFFKDGTELSYLWPSTHATKAGTWRIGE